MKHPFPLLSVILPNYNHAAYLDQRIESIVSQSFQDMEIIVLDDCSTDHSREIIQNWAEKDTRIQTHFNTTNSGSPFRQWKKGLDIARGEYVWIAESDDYAHPKLASALLASLKKHPNAGVVYCQSNLINSTGDLTGNHIVHLAQLHPTLWDRDFCILGTEALSKYMSIINIIPNAGAAIFRKELVHHLDWDKLYSYKLAGDRYFWIQLLQQTDICFVAQSFNFFRQHGQTVRSSQEHTLRYLREVRSVVLEIHKTTGVASRSKTIRQWCRQVRKMVRGKKGFPLGFVLRAGCVGLGFMRLWLPAKKKR